MNTPCTRPESALPLAGHPVAPVNGLMSLWDMLDLYGFKTAKAVAFLAEAKWFWGLLDQDLRIGDPLTYLRPVERPRVEAATKAAIELVREICQLADLEGIEPELWRLEQLIWPPPGIPPISGLNIASAITHLLSRLQDELKAKNFLFLSAEMAKYWGKNDAFGLGDKFVDALPEIESAGNCLAIGEGTACVMHLNRAMDAVLTRLARRLRITIGPKDTWGVILNAMSGKINEMPQSTPAQKKRRDRWSETRVHLFHVKEAWRDRSFHNKERYSPARAREIYEAVRVFMSGFAAL